MTSVMKVSASVLGTFNDLPGPVRTTTIAVAALGAAAFLLVPKVLAARTALLEYNAAQLASGKSAASARGAMRGAAGVLAGPWGLAIGAGITALGIFSAKHAEGKKRVEDMTEAIKADSGALGENARAQAVSVLTANGAIAAAERLGISLETVTDAALGSPAAQDALSASLDQYAVSATQAMNAGRGGATALTLQQQAAIMLTNATDSQANATVLATEGARRQAEAMGGATYAAYQLGSAQSDTAADTKALNDEIAKQIGLLEDQATAALDVADAEQRYRDDMRDAKEKLDALNDAVRKHGESSKAAKLAQEAYDQSIRDATRSAIDAARKTRDKAVADAEAAGSADSAATANAAYRTELDKLRDKAKKGSALRKNLNGLIADLDALGKDRTANVVINIAQRASTINKANRIDAATAKGKAGGGLVVGYGSGTSDSVPINASNGEFVMKASAVKRIGVGTLSAMNSGQSGGSITSLAPVFHIDARGSTMTAQEFRAIAKTAVDDGYRELLTQSRAR